MLTSLITKVSLGGVIYDIDTSTTTAVELLEVMADKNIDDYTRGVLTVSRLFGEDAPYTGEALEKAGIFLSGNVNNNQTETKQDGADGTRLISIYDNWGLVASAFKSQYNIDLYTEELHYFVFQEYMLGLTTEQTIVRIIEILNTDPNKEKDKEVREGIIATIKRYGTEELKEKYGLTLESKQVYTDEDTKRIADFDNMFLPKGLLQDM